MKSIYTDQTYLSLNPTWHEEDSSWKAEQVLRMLRQHEIPIGSVAEVGCGVGGILARLRDALPENADFHGFDIAPDAITRARKRECDRLHFHNQDLFTTTQHFDLLLVMDVVEHVPDYLGFLERCKARARFKIYHIPLDLHASSIIRASFLNTRKTIGHLHYFTAESALASLADTGHEIVDFRYTDGGMALARLHPSVQRTVANLGRRLVSVFSTRWAARLFGGYSLLILAK
jgi:SAM-dependent methyltransferase